MKKMWSRLTIRCFWSNIFQIVRAEHYHMAYEQGRFDAKAESIYGIIDNKTLEEIYEN
jgi:hypothetical protein